MGVSNELRDLTATTWAAAVEHRFVDELWSGRIDRAALARYVDQDQLFVDAFLALLGATVAACDEPRARRTLARQLGVVAGPENDFFDRSLAALDVTGEPTPNHATRSFLDLMDAARRRGDYANCLALLLVAEWLYLDWASRDAPLPEDPIGREWIALHTGAEFRAWVEFLHAELDRVGAGDTQARAAFVRAVELELEFFDAVYEPATD